MNGVITRVLTSRGYGFIKGDDGISRWFHATSVMPAHAFDTMREGQPVEFDSIKVSEGTEGTNNGLRAVRVKRVATQ